MARTQAPVEREGIRQIELPPGARARSTLTRVDYTDAFVVDIPTAQEHSAEEWMRAALEGAPEPLRRSLRSGWRTLGGRLGPDGDASYVLGWEVRQSEAQYVLLGMTFRLGMQAELLLERHEHTLLFSTLLQHHSPLAPLVWAFIERPHVRVVRHVLEQARRRWQ
jgi:hypothetical protein